MPMPDLMSRYAKLSLWARLGIFAVLGAVAALGQAPFGWALVSVLGFASAFGLYQTAGTQDRAFHIGWAYGFGYFLLTLQWLVSPFLVEPEQHGWMAPFALALMSAGLALFWGAAFWIAGRVGRPSALIVSLPLTELARAYVFTGFAWGMPAYGMVDSALGQGVAWIGSHGLNVLVLATAWAISMVALNSGWLRLVAAFVATIGIASVLAPAPEAQEPRADAPVIRLIQPNAAQHEKWDPDLIPVIFERALELTRAEADAPIALTIWPETSLPDILNYGDDLLSQVTRAAGPSPVVIGANRFVGPRLYNAAVYVAADGEIQATYDKHHLVPFGEYLPFGEVLERFGIYGMAASQGHGFSPGAGAQVMDLGPLGLALPLICYEVVFPQDVRASKVRPDMLMQITNDAWFGDFSGPFQHLVQAQMRAMEMGLPMVRAANTGVSAMIDARGRIVAQLPLNEAGFLDVRRQDPLPQTLYAWVGDAPILVFLLLVLAVYLALRPRNRLTP